MKRTAGFVPGVEGFPSRHEQRVIRRTFGVIEQLVRAAPDSGNPALTELGNRNGEVRDPIWVGAALLEQKPPVDIGDESGPASITSKADVLKYLKDSFTFGHKAVATLNASNLVEPIKSSGGKTTTRLFLATFAPAHAFDHYGQMVEYLRMNGIVPPASRGQ